MDAIKNFLGIETAPPFNPTDFIRDNLMKNKILIIGKQTCPHTRQINNIFINGLQETPKLIDLDKMEHPEHSNLLFRDLVEKTDRKATVPKIFVCGEFIGGGIETQKFIKEGRLQKLLATCDMKKLSRPDRA